MSSSSSDDWKQQVKAEITEAVLRDCRRIFNEIIDTMVEQNEGSTSTLMYDINPAQNQSMANTLMCRQLKEHLAERSKTYPSDLPVSLLTSDLRSPFSNDDTPNIGQGSREKKDKGNEEPKASEPTTKVSSKSKISKASSKGKNKRGRQTQMTISLQGRLIAAAEETVGGSDDPGNA